MEKKSRFKNLNHSKYKRKSAKIKRELCLVLKVSCVCQIAIEYAIPGEVYKNVMKQFSWLTDMVGWGWPSSIYYENHYQTVYAIPNYSDKNIPNFYENTKYQKMLYSKSGKPLFCSKRNCICLEKQRFYIPTGEFLP